MYQKKLEIPMTVGCKIFLYWLKKREEEEKDEGKGKVEKRMRRGGRWDEE